ncbi:thioredoxin H2-like isoform X1 [Cucurbita pepo subsp. pepo]|uniref:thioredoxin H2-like isoform X1 n=1 Tax=Cucurbita pepo subsp. pepo TaxID=3664 RepID=UPI000C9D74F9|nr:thioredoxin H2-like isoform X1 [Cucurbita pepo subsp. pepo]
MGVLFSTIGTLVSKWFGPSTASAEAASSEPSSVSSFHSSARWKLHFDSVQESSKLVRINFTFSIASRLIEGVFSRTTVDRLMEPSFNAMASTYTDVEFIKIDVDELSDVAQDFGVQAMPTFVLLRRGKVLDTVVGARKEELEKKIQKHRSASGGT